MRRMSERTTKLTISGFRFTTGARPEQAFVSRTRKAPAATANSLSTWLVLTAYTLLTIVMTWPLARNLTTAIPGDGFDGWQNYWNQWWIKVALVDRQQNPFATDLLYYPTGVDLYFHTLNPFNGITTLPVQLSLGLIPAYNAVVWLSWVLGGYGVYLLARWVLQDRIRDAGCRIPGAGVRTPDSGLRTPNSLAAFFAGLVFTFAPFHMAHLLGHMQVMALEWIPFYVLYLMRATHAVQSDGPWLRSALLAGLFLTLTGLCDWYFVLYLLFFTALVFLWQSVTAVRNGSLSGRTVPSLLLPGVVAGGVFFVCLSPLLIPMVRAATQYAFMVRPATDLYTFSASVMDFFVPNRLHTLFRPQSYSWIGNQVAPPSERTISIGYLPLLLTVFAVWRDRKRAGFWLFCAGFFLLLALGPRIHWGDIMPADIPSGSTILERWTPYAFLNRIVPFMRISRSVSRYALMVQLAVAVAAAIGLAGLLAWFGRGRAGRQVRTLPGQSWLVAGAASLVLLAEFWVAPFRLSPPDTPAYYSQLAAEGRGGAVLNLPMNYDRPGYLLYQTVHQQPLTVAYISRDDPRTLTERMPVLQHFRHLGPDIITDDPVRAGQTVLHDLGVEVVVLDRYKMPGGLEREYTEQLAAAIFAGQPPDFSDERLTVYSVTPPAEPETYLVLGAENWGALAEHEQKRSRLLRGKPAQIFVYHAAPGATLHMRYHSLADATLVLGGDDLAPQTLPPAPAGRRISLPLPDTAQQHDPYIVTLTAGAADAVWIEAIGMVGRDGGE